MNETVKTKRNGYSLEDDLMPIIKGTLAPPHLKPIEDDIGATILHYHQMYSGTAAFVDGKKEWNARFFLDCGQMGQLYGSGIVAWTAWKDGAYRATGMKFAICEHKAVAGPSANRTRGYHQASCEKCGLDLTVDSGD